MKKLIISSALGAMLLAGGIAVAQSDAPAKHGPMMADANGDGILTKAEVTAGLDKLFVKMDPNGDGKVTQEERQAMRQQRMDARFAAIDADKNGQISKTEFAAKRQGRSEEGGRHMGRRHGGHGGMGMMGMRGRGADADKDGTLTRAEFLARPLAMFDRADANKDGKVTADEMKAARPDRHHRGMGDHHDTPPAPKG